ncbi:LmbE family protein [Anaerolineae bacterium]|nr:LmbE family protein [Anaerolineae bacterium]
MFTESGFSAATRLLIVAAHPDDEILACGGTIARALDSGAEVCVLFLGEGVSARFPFGSYDSEQFREETRHRLASAGKSLSILGVSDVSFGERYCCQFDTLPQLTLTKEIEQVMDRFKPTILLTHNPSEVNIDHRVTYDAVEAACRPTRSSVPRQIYTFEIVCSGSWTFETTFKPNVFVDVSQFWEKKLKAWHCYSGEVRPFPFPRSDIGLETLAHYRGMQVALLKAEAFRLMRAVI